MISEDSLPTKSRSLRAKSIAKRLATEASVTGKTNNEDCKQSSGAKSSSKVKRSSSKHHTMSKYRRKVANAKERERMKLVSEAFDKLSSVVPVYKMMTSNNAPIVSATAIGDAENKNPVTKVSTLRCAIAYINSLQRLIEDANNGLLDPNLYNQTEPDLELPHHNNNNNNNGKAVVFKKANNSKKKGGKKGDQSKAKKGSKSSNNFKVRQYHAADFRGGHVAKKGGKKANNKSLVMPTTSKIMSKAQLNLAIAKGLQNCKPIYTPPPPASKKPAAQPQLMPNNNQQMFNNLQIIQLRPLNFSNSTTSIIDEESEASNDFSSMPTLEVFLQNQQPSPSASTNSSLSLSSSQSESSSGCFQTILEEAHILDDIQAVLLDADNFDILV